MKKILLIFSLILGIFCRPVFAAEIDLENIDAEYVFVGGSASVTFDVFQGEPNQSYKYIFFGGPNDTSSINTFNPVSNQFVSLNDDWSLMPSLTTNSNGYSRVEGVFSVPSNQNFCSAIDDYCYQLYVGIYNIQTAQEDSYSAPQEFVVLPLNFFSLTPTPSTVPTFFPTLIPTLNPTIHPPISTATPTSAASSINSSLLPTISPSPTINPTKFKTIASSSANLVTPTSTLFDNLDSTDSSLSTIQTGSNPTKILELQQIKKTKSISNLGIKVFFIFLLTSISFILYTLCFYGYTFEMLLSEINHFFSIIKPQFKKIFFILKKISKTIYQYFQAIFKQIKTSLNNYQVTKKYFKLIYQKFIIFLKFCLKISQKIIKYFSYFFNQFFIFIKDHIHIKIPRKLKRYLYHKRSHTLSLIFLVFVGIFFIKPIFASIGPKINKSDTPTTENNFLTQNINLEPKQDFSWGVLSFNSNKSIYSVGETANLSMAVLNDKGAVVCDALLKLEIVLPDKTTKIFTTEDKQIKINSQCSSQEVASIPDYQSFLKLDQIGEYQVTLTAETKNGKYSIQDSFRVVQNSPFSIERISATRIYPLNSYPVNLKIAANQDFEGTIVERVPLSFNISQTNAKIETNQYEQLLSWNVSLKKNQAINLNYTYKAPEISPERYLLGPINIFSESNNIFQENRSWQIASDAPGFSDGILVFVANGTIFNYKTWDGNEFGSVLSGPTLAGNGVVRHLASAVSDDGDYVGVVAEVYNTTTGLHSVYGTVWDVDAGQWIDTSLLWTFTDTTADNIHQRYFNIVALGNDEFVVVGKDDPDTTLNNAGWLAGTGWTQETDLTTIGSIGKFVELIRRPGTTNLLLCTTDEASDTNCRYYKGATPYGTSANVNDDWTSNTEVMTLSDDPQNWDSHSFFDSTDNTRGAIIHNPNSASGLTINARKFTVNDTAISYGTTAVSGALSDDYTRSLIAPIPGRSEALVLGAGILEDLKAYRVGVTATAPNWTTITPNLEGNAGLHVTTLDINFNWAMEFDGTRGVVAWAQVGTTNPVHFRRWTIDGNFEASEQNIDGSPDNGYDRTMIARRDPVATDEILFVALNDDVDVNTVWWDGSANSFYTSGNKAWAEQATVSNAVQDSFWSADFQFYPSPGRPVLISPENSVTVGVTINPTFFTMVSTDADANSIQYKIILGTDATFVGTTQVFDQSVNNLGWSGQDVGTSAYSSGTTATYIYQSTLDYSTVYFWKVQAIKYSGSDTWSTSSDVYTFTTMDDPDGVVEVFSSVGSTDWIAPDDVYFIKVQAWGGGGGGGDGISGYGGAGGGGGAFVAGTMVVIPGNTYPIIIGNGGAGGASNGNGASGADTTFNTNSFVAKGGAGGVGSSGLTGGSGGLASESTGTIKYDGGNGGIGYNATSDAGGGGGGAAGPHGSGIVGGNADTVMGGNGGRGNNNYGGIGGIAANGSVGSTGASDPLGGGGGSGGDNGTAGGNGGAPGAGGGGGEANTASTGKGSGGQLIITYSYFVANDSPSSPYLPYVNNTSAQSGQQSPVYGLIDHTPAFSAVFDDPNTGDTAAYYQLQIGSDTDWASAEIWDSTKSAVSGTCNEDSRCADIVYSGGTSLVDGSTYYWRLKYWDNSDVGGSWSDTQQFSMNNPPSVSDVIINGNNSINLSENSSIGISWIATITDADTYLNLNTAVGKLYRSGVGQSCTPDNNNCYQDTSCDFINCAGNTCDALCSANLYFFTEATDTGSTFVDQYYQAWVEATDNYTEIGSTFSSSILIDVNTLSAFSIGQSLVYGEVFAGSDTGSSNTIVTVTNTGNSLINLEITGDYMCTDYPSCGGNNIEPYNQQYNLNTFTYGTGTTLSLAPKIINIGISKPTQSPSNSSRNLYWGIGIPGVKPPGNYQGSVTILVD